MNNDRDNPLPTSRRLLLLANWELLIYLRTISKTALSEAVFIESQILLELLMDDTDSIRRDAFGTLMKYLSLKDFYRHEAKGTFRNLQQYFEYCHHLHGERRAWTLLFSPEEREKYKKRHLQQQQVLY